VECRSGGAEIEAGEQGTVESKLFCWDPVMPEYNEKRQFRRFEIPGGEGQFKRVGLAGSLRQFSKSYPVMNASVGGISLLCDEEFKQGEEVLIRLIAPREAPIVLRSICRWQKRIALDIDKVIGFEFMPFSANKGSNPPELLDVLRRLYARYTS
jgi:hypothetical protein